MLLVCSTYVSVMCMYSVLFDLRRKLKVTESSKIRKRYSQSNFYYGRLNGTLNCSNKKQLVNVIITTARHVPFNKTVTNINNVYVVFIVNEKIKPRSLASSV